MITPCPPPRPERPRRERLPALALVAAVAALAGGCGDDMEPTAVFVEVELNPGVAVPEYLLVTWFDAETALLRDKRVPATGSLVAGKAPLVTVVFEVPRPQDALPARRVLA